MSVETGRKAMEFGSKLTQGSCGIVFFGGEPLLKRDLIYQLVDYGYHLERYRAGRFHYKITTNGLLLDDEFLDYSIRHNILIALSCDGITAAHDSHRRLANGEPSFTIVEQRLKRLLAVRPYSSVLLVINPDTAPNLSQSIQWLIDQSCRYLIVSLNYAAAWTEADFRILKREFEKLGDLYIQWTREGKKFYFSPFEVKLSSHINQHNYQKERCELAQRQISVDPDGNLFPCVQFTKAGRNSDWRIGDLDEGINEEARQRLYRMSVEDKESCRTCAIKNRCNNTCGCLNWQTTGGINTVSPALCRYEQMLMPIADRVGNTLYKKRNPHFIQKHYNAAYPVLSLLEDTWKETIKP